MWKLLGISSLAVNYIARFVLPTLEITLFVLFLFLRQSSLLILFLAFFSLNIVLYLLSTFKDEIIDTIETNILRRNDSDTLLLISPSEIRKSSLNNTFSQQNWNAAWINTLEQEIGYFSVSDNITDIKDKQAIIISSSVQNINPTFIKTNVQEGKTIVIERPQQEIASYFGVNILKKNAASKKITSKFLEEMPLNCDFDIVSCKKFKVLMSIDRKPAIIYKRLGKGKLIFILFDYSKQLVSLQQGVPNDDFYLKHKYGLIGMIETADMAFDERLLDNNIPHADVLESFIIGLLGVPRWGKLPAGCNSALVISHDEDYCNEHFLKMIEEEIKAGIKSTFFITPLKTILDKKLKFMIKNNIEIGIHWDRFPNELFFKKKSNKDLLNHIKLSKTQIISSRIHYLKWNNHYTNTFRLLIKNGIKVDSTYGINFGKGYVFSTSYFFHPIDTNGSLMHILELPFEIMENRGDVTLNYIKNLIIDNDAKYHGVLCFNFHPSKYESSVHIRGKIIELALKYKILVFTLKEYYNFYNKRLSSSIKTSGNKIFVDSKTKMNLIIPNNIKEVTLNGRKATLNQMKNLFLVTLDKGKHVVHIK